jgi:hypothetical protein
MIHRGCRRCKGCRGEQREQSIQRGNGCRGFRGGIEDTEDGRGYRRFIAGQMEQRIQLWNHEGLTREEH